MKDLITKLEQATGPSRELDAEIGIAIGVWRRRDLGGGCYLWEENGVNTGNKPPYYTSSIDAALTLVPKGWQWQVSNRAKAPHKSRAYINNGKPINASLGGLTRNHEYIGFEETAATSPIAICIACLKAMEGKE